MLVNIMVGRFQTVTTAHADIFSSMKKEKNPSIIYIIEGNKSSKDKNTNPFTGLERKRLVEKFGMKVDIITSIVELEDVLFIQNLKPVKWFAGSDRASSYRKFKNSFSIFNDCEIIEIDRVNDVSASKIREAAIQNRFDDFKNMIPEPLLSDIPWIWNNIRSRNGNTTECTKE